MATVNSAYVIIGLVVLVATLGGFIASGIRTLWKIASSVKGMTDSLTSVEKELMEIKITLNKADERIDKVTEIARFNERDLKTAFKYIDGLSEEFKKSQARCLSIQDEKRKSMLG